MSSQARPEQFVQVPDHRGEPGQLFREFVPFRAFLADGGANLPKVRFRDGDGTGDARDLHVMEILRLPSDRGAEHVGPDGGRVAGGIPLPVGEGDALDIDQAAALKNDVFSHVSDVLMVCRMGVLSPP